jgi:hypothetical protein
MIVVSISCSLCGNSKAVRMEINGYLIPATAPLIESTQLHFETTIFPTSVSIYKSTMKISYEVTVAYEDVRKTKRISCKKMRLFFTDAPSDSVISGSAVRALNLMAIDPTSEATEAEIEFYVYKMYQKWLGLHYTIISEGGVVTGRGRAEVSLQAPPQVRRC